MDAKAIFVLILATVNAGVLPVPKVLEGPSSKTTIIGPDGSKISAFAPGGKIVLEENAGPVLQGAPEVVAVAGVPQPPPVVVGGVTPAVEAQPEVEVVPVEPIPVPVEPVPVPVEPVPVPVEPVPVPVEPVPIPVEPISLPAVIPVNPDEDVDIEAATEGPIPVPVESSSEELLEISTNSPTVDKITETPFQVAPLVKNIVPVVRVVDPLAVSYLHTLP